MSLISQKQIAVHPVVLLSVVDHYYRLAKETSRRVIGVLLGEITADRVDITSCYALPFEEDPKDKKVWFVDHVYNETNEVFRKYCLNPVFVVIDVQEKVTPQIIK